jgi:hypothetical protein
MKWLSRFVATRVTATLAVLGFAVAAILVVPEGVALADHGVALDHFKCYLAQDPTPWNQQVGLRDQFTSLTTNVLNAVRFCNPTRKFHGGVFTPVKDADAHLTLYRLNPLPAPIQRQIIVGNQFGTAQTWDVSGPFWLAAPTHKQGHQQGPQNLDHFLCYRAAGPAINQQAWLQDEFVAEVVGVLSPVMFCNPAEKLHNDVVTPIEHPDEHLACYQIQGQPGNRNRFIRNQFGVEQISITNPNMLCAPSRKALPGAGGA